MQLFDFLGRIQFLKLLFQSSQFMEVGEIATMQLFDFLSCN